jgi:hypothetical protein
MNTESFDVYDVSNRKRIMRKYCNRNIDAARSVLAATFLKWKTNVSEARQRDIQFKVTELVTTLVMLPLTSGHSHPAGKVCSEGKMLLRRLLLMSTCLSGTNIIHMTREARCN